MRTDRRNVARLPRTAVAAATVALAACGPSTAAGPAPEPAPRAISDAAASPAGAPEPDAQEPAADAAPAGLRIAEPGSAEEAFVVVLEALAAGATRPIRGFVPPGGTLALRTHICRKPIYGIGNCRDERAEADRRRVRDELLARWQELMAAAAAADPEFAPADLPWACEEADGRFACAAVVRFGADECRGDLEASVSAVFRRFEGEWRLLELGYDENILICE